MPGNREEAQEGWRPGTACRHHQRQRPLQLKSPGDSKETLFLERKTQVFIQQAKKSNRSRPRHHTEVTFFSS